MKMCDIHLTEAVLPEKIASYVTDCERSKCQLQHQN